MDIKRESEKGPALALVAILEDASMELPLEYSIPVLGAPSANQETDSSVPVSGAGAMGE